MQIGACALFLVGAVGLIDESSRLANPLPNLSYERVSLIRIDPKSASRGGDAPGVRRAVEQVAVTWKPPLMNGSLPTARVTASATSIAQNAGYTAVSPEYFTLFDIQIVRGRTFTAAEAAAGAAVALVSEATAAALWPGARSARADARPCGGSRGTSRPATAAWSRAGHRRDGGRGHRLDRRGDRCQLCLFPDRPAGSHGDDAARPGPDRRRRGAAVGGGDRRDSSRARDAISAVFRCERLVGAAAWVFQAFSVTASIARPRRPALRLLGNACSGLVPRGTTETGVRRPDGARRQRLADRAGHADRDVSHRLGRSCRRAGGRGRPDTSDQRRRFRSCRTSVLVRSWSGAAIVLVATAVAALSAAARRRAHRSCASPSSGVSRGRFCEHEQRV